MIVSMDEFTLAVERIKLNVNLQLSNEQKLELYSYYKQATVGPCNTGKPGFFDFTGRAKWEAWHKLGSLPSDEAKMHYISLVDKHDPDWQQKPIEESTGTAGSSMGGASGTGPVVSRMAAIKDDSILHDKDKTLIDWATEGNVDRIKELIARGDDVNEPDQEVIEIVMICKG
jgi:diazepam-binding inhibitor (GABA receptor modulating acyl-CoA-binding protein)